MIRVCGTCRNSKRLVARPRTAWARADFCIFGSSCRKRTLFLVGNVDSRDAHRIARKCAGTGGRCSVTGQKRVHAKASASRSKFSFSLDHARPPLLSLALAMVLTMNARRFQRTHLLSGTCSSLNASKDIGMGVVDFAPTCGSEPMVDGVRTAVVGSDRTSRVLDASSGREDESSDKCCVGENTIVFL